MATLFVFGGLVGSGSKEKAMEYANDNGLSFLSVDTVRKELKKSNPDLTNTLLYEEIYRRIKKHLDGVGDILLDATNLYGKQRKHLVNIMKPHRVVMNFVIRAIEECIIADENDENPEGQDLVMQKFITAEIPFNEGFAQVNYFVEPVKVETVAHYLSQYYEREKDFEDDVVLWANIFMNVGKSYLETRPEGSKNYGYANMSAQIAFQTLHTMSRHVEFIQNVVQLILYKKRYLGANTDKGKETLKEQLGEELFKKLMVLINY